MPKAGTSASKSSTKINKKFALWLLILALAIYLTTRLVSLPDFPIYFFTDEAIQTQHAADLIHNGFRDPQGVLLPTYFKNGGQYNLSLSVYVQVIPYLIFGKSVWVTRGVSVFFSLIAAISLGLILRDVFRLRNAWLGPVLLAAVPAWFLHSRTAFETIMMASLYAAFLYFYLLYRQGRLKCLYLALLFGALTFYSYSPGQVIIVVTGVMLLIADAPYHWKNRKTALVGLGILVVAILPYLRFTITKNEGLVRHLTVLNSYWVQPLPLPEKLFQYFIRYLKGLNPIYWYWPNPSFIENLWPQTSLPSWLFSFQSDLDRHIMKGYGHILYITFPFWILGMIRCIKRFKKPACRTLILATLAAPTGAAIVDWGITRGMVFIIPTTLITALGFESAFKWLHKQLPQLKPLIISLTTFSFFSIFSILMLSDALSRGPLWYDDYGLGGMQYGASQVFTRATKIALAQPETTVFVSSTWANGTDVIMRYFTDDIPNVRMGNINAYIEQIRPLDRSMIFIMTEDDLILIEESGKFNNVSIEETIPYPDGREGFYFVRLEYIDNIEAIFEAERIERLTLIPATITFKDQQVKVEYPKLDMNEIGHVFDGDPTSLIRTLETNPLRLVLTFPEPISMSGVILRIGGTPTQITVTTFLNDTLLQALTESYDKHLGVHDVSLSFDQAYTVNRVEIAVLNIHDGEIAHVHLWEVGIE